MPARARRRARTGSTAAPRRWASAHIEVTPLDIDQVRRVLLSNSERPLPVRGGVQRLRQMAWPGGGPHRPNFDGAYKVITLKANSCLAAGCDELLPVPDLCLRSTPVLRGMMTCGTCLYLRCEGGTEASVSVHGEGFGECTGAGRKAQSASWRGSGVPQSGGSARSGPFFHAKSSGRFG